MSTTRLNYALGAAMRSNTSAVVIGTGDGSGRGADGFYPPHPLWSSDDLGCEGDTFGNFDLWGSIPQDWLSAGVRLRVYARNESGESLVAEVDLASCPLRASFHVSGTPDTYTGLVASVRGRPSLGFRVVGVLATATAATSRAVFTGIVWGDGDALAVSGESAVQGTLLGDAPSKGITDAAFPIQTSTLAAYDAVAAKWVALNAIQLGSNTAGLHVANWTWNATLGAWQKMQTDGGGALSVSIGQNLLNIDGAFTYGGLGAFPIIAETCLRNTSNAQNIFQRGTTRGAGLTYEALPDPSVAATESPSCDIQTVTRGVTKSAAAYLLQVDVMNDQAALQYFQVFNKATAPNAGDVPVYCIGVPAGTRQVGTPSRPRYLSAGLAWAWSTTKGVLTLPAAQGQAQLEYV